MNNLIDIIAIKRKIDHKIFEIKCGETYHDHFIKKIGYTCEICGFILCNTYCYTMNNIKMCLLCHINCKQILGKKICDVCECRTHFNVCYLCKWCGWSCSFNCMRNCGNKFKMSINYFHVLCNKCAE